MNKPKRQKSAAIQKLQQNRSEAEFHKTKKRMMLAAKIQDAIKVKSLTYKAFAGIMDQHESVISKWVSGTHNFTAETLFDIEEKLGICLVAIDEVKTMVVEKNYVAVVKSKNSVSINGMVGSGRTSLSVKGYISISATPLRSHQHVDLPIFNTTKHDC
jgi:hypothetical protein